MWIYGCASALAAAIALKLRNHRRRPAAKNEPGAGELYKQPVSTACSSLETVKPSDPCLTPAEAEAPAKASFFFTC